MSKIKISQLDEKSTVDGTEMIPILIGDLNYKVSVDTLINKSKEILHSYQQYTYDELKQLKDSELLIPGEHYLLIDYQCIYTQPVSEETIICDYDGWLIMLLALSENEFSNDVHVIFTLDSSYVAKGGLPIIECKYIFDNFSEYTWTNTLSKGVIIDLKDSNDNLCNYDFKHIKFRRWALKDVTENNTIGAANQPSAYRCYGTKEEPKRSDGRTWVGSGLMLEREWIRSIFDGTFNSVMWGQPALHEDYITKTHKAFKRTNERLQYLAYDTTLDSISQLTAAKPGLVKFEIDTADYIDCYTFECNGDDISNIVINNKVNRCNNKLLPNIVILLQSTIEPASNSLFDNTIHGYNTTFAIHDLYEGTFPQMYRCEIEESRNNIFSSFRLNNTKLLKVCLNNYVSGTLSDCSFEDLQYSVLFGYYSSMSMQSCAYNLLFGNDIRICNTSGNWVGPDDGNYWYNNTIQEWFGYNIMAPFQYSVFYPHTNTNTIKLPYNKGVTLMGTFQDNCVERMRWGTVVEYGAIQGNYLTELTRVHVSPAAFVSQVAHSSDSSSIYTLEGAVQFPSIANCDVKMYQGNLSKIVANLNSDTASLLATSGNRKIFTNNGTSPILKYYYEL